ncbi:gastrin-releasing peptide isoform X2 [Nothobranchius furzeri]|uniref:gastrin-releasing peptide isoform X2 n=1 Tax=Nothobranchius furzeri TaxID=105023 RepID=UPI003904DB29
MGFHGAVWVICTPMEHRDGIVPVSPHPVSNRFQLVLDTQGHLMGKKSIKSLPEQQETNSYSLYLTPSHSARISELDQQEPPLENLPTQRQRTLQRLFHSIWREVDGEKHLQEMSNLLLLALKLQENTSL